MKARTKIEHHLVPAKILSSKRPESIEEVEEKRVHPI